MRRINDGGEKDCGATARLWWGEVKHSDHGKRAKPHVSQVK
jgi:hypothetical protein